MEIGACKNAKKEREKKKSNSISFDLFLLLISHI